ncbi:MAG: transcriptional regulator with XRE-family HTH domain [Nitriliruptoraceae bacterium]|jgi:transcriptional regulator with XRE-family HTH domain
MSIEDVMDNAKSSQPVDVVTTIDIAAAEAADSYAVELGERLRNVRQQQQLSLHDVEARSEGELKASVVGAYERGERAVSVARLRTLAEFYRVPVSSLLPSTNGSVSGSDALRTGETLVLDLTALEHPRIEAQDREIIERYVGAIQAQRGDYNGRVLTVRASDVRALAAVLDRGVPEFREHLLEVGAARAR